MNWVIAIVSTPELNNLTLIKIKESEISETEVSRIIISHLLFSDNHFACNGNNKDDSTFPRIR